MDAQNGVCGGDNLANGIRVAVNVSPLQFKNQTLGMVLTNALASSDLSARRLEIEITEAVLMQNDDGTISMLHQLRALGVRIALDDFGTGYFVAKGSSINN